MHYLRQETVFTLMVLMTLFIPCSAREIIEPETAKTQQSLVQDKLLIENGKKIAQDQCSTCHAIGKTGNSPNPKSPPFRTLHKKWPVETLEESLAEGIVTGHNEMPEVTMSPKQITAFIAFLKSLEE